MCGIAGIRQFGHNPITMEEITLLLCELEHRGNHATGVALLDDEGLQVYKAPVPAWEFTKTDTYKQFLAEHLSPRTKTALLHTRFATVGNPEFNQNNHPIWDNKTAIVHNGHVSNHFQIFTDQKFKRVAETDSDVFRALVTEYGLTQKCIREMGKLNGSAAIACVRADDPEKLLLARSGSPLVVAFTPNADKIYWASEAKAIFQASRPYKKVMGVWVQDARTNVSVASVPDNTAWLFDRNMMTTHAEFPVCITYRAPDYSKNGASYHLKTRGWKREKKAKDRADKLVQESKKTVDKPAALELVDRKGAIVANSSRIDNRPLANSLAVCGGCGTGVMNKNGVPWSVIDCPTCGAKVMIEED